MKQNHVLIKGHVLYANKGTTIKNVCNHLQSRKVDRIIVRNSHEKEIGYVPLCRILQLLQREKSLCEHLIRQMNLEQIADALHGKIMYAPSAEHMFWQCILYEEHLFDDLRHALVITGVKTLKLDIPLVPETRIKWAFVPLHIAIIYILKLCLDEEIIPRCRFPCSRGYHKKHINWQKKQ